MRTVLTFGLLLCIVTASGAQAASESELSDTRRFAQTQCGACHIVEKPKREFSVYRTAGAPPSFYALASDPAMTTTKMRRSLRLPSGNMANLLLTDADIDGLITYIVSLRTP